MYHSSGGKSSDRPPMTGGFFYGKKTAEMRSRIFATVVYPESAPEDWRERLESTHVAAMVSPLHCRDTLPTGEVKRNTGMSFGDMPGSRASPRHRSW